jgi:general bacterial porin, GBP family
MKIKKSLLAILALSSMTSLAHAEVSVFGNDKTNVDFYGILDAAYGSVSHSLGIDPTFPASVNPVSPVINVNKSGGVNVPGSATGFFNGGISPSRLGVKGTMDFGNDVKGFFTIEAGLNITTGRLSDASAYLARNSGANGANAVPFATTAGANSSVDGQLSSRQAFVGASVGQLGSLAIGRNYAPIFDIVVKYDPVQASQLFSPLGLSGSYGAGGGLTEDARVSQSLKYTNKIGSFNFGALTKYHGNAGDPSAKSALGLNAGYEDGPFGVQAAYESFTDAVTGAVSTTTNGIAVTAYNTKAVMLAAKYKINDNATVKAGYESYTLSKPSEKTAANYVTSYYGQLVTGTTPFAGADRTTHILFVGGDYNFTDKLNVAAGVYDVSPQQSDDYTAAAGSTYAAAGQASGDQRYYSLLADYHYTKNLDTYLGYMHAAFSGNAFPANSTNVTLGTAGTAPGYYQSNNIYAVGARFKF